MGPIEGCQQGSRGDGWVTAYHSRSVNQPAGSFAMCPSLFVCLFGDALCVFVYVMCLACQGGKVYCIILIISRSFAPPLPLFLTAFNHCAELSRSG